MQHGIRFGVEHEHRKHGYGADRQQAVRRLAYPQRPSPSSNSMRSVLSTLEQG
jgi:hypothetical protein